MASEPPRWSTVFPNNPSVFSGPTLVTGGTFTQLVSGSSRNGFERLQEATAPAAFHNSEQRSDPPKCHPNTRVAILRRITDWVLGADADAGTRQAFMMWLYGSAGAGKSAIAQTLAEEFNDDGSLLASFFFSRTDPTRNHARQLVATIAYQMALHIPETKELIVAVVEHDPLIFSKSLETQFACLIFEPLQSFTNSNRPNSRSTYLIIFDGLDECEDKDARGKLLRLLVTARRGDWLPTLQFLIVSRPELDIKTVFDSQDLETLPHRLALDDEYRSNTDIQCFLQDKFQEIKHDHPHRAYIPSEWPSHDAILDLVQRSSGQFIYASTVVKYVSSTAYMPTRRLEIIFGLRPAQADTPFAALDELYTYIFSTANDLHGVLEVLGFILLGLNAPTVTWRLEEHLRLEPGVIELLFSTLGSIVSVETHLMGLTDIKILHASLGDFLLDESRSKKLYLYPAAKHAEYAHLCFGHMSTGSMSKSYVLSMIIHHLKMALPTPELHEDITRFSFIPVYHDWSREWMGLPFSDFFENRVDPFLSCIKALDWNNAAKLHDLQQRNFDQMLVDRLPEYYAHPKLVFLVSVIALTGSSLISREKFLSHAQSYLNDEDDYIEIDRKALRILRSHPRIDQYFLYLSHFLCDSTRSGPYGVTDKIYAEAAHYLYISMFEVVKIPSYWSYGRVPTHLCILAMLFDRAGKSATLLDEIARSHTKFGSVIEALKIWDCAPVERKLAEDAIANYVKRMTGNFFDRLEFYFRKTLALK